MAYATATAHTSTAPTAGSGGRISSTAPYVGADDIAQRDDGTAYRDPQERGLQLLERVATRQQLGDEP
ncbi:MAG: hypothetical protein HGA45_06335 [Chloroflexales bacterium]|nr:hypothetical protein [Chloroflexales bacterium]